MLVQDSRPTFLSLHWHRNQISSNQRMKFNPINSDHYFNKQRWFGLANHHHRGVITTLIACLTPMIIAGPWPPLYVTLRLGTLDSTAVVEWLSKDTNVSYQVYKRVWPATQRESLFWSTIRHCPADDEEGPDYWIVTNHSTEHEQAPVSSCSRALYDYTTAGF